MQDPRETRRIASNWREYVADMRETFRVFAWVWRKFVTPQSRRKLFWSMFGLVMMAAFGLMAPLGIRWLVDSHAQGLEETAYWSFGAICAVLVVGRLFHWFQSHFREWVLGLDQVAVDVRTTEMFFGKSLGQHLRDSGLLSAANVEKGRHRVMEVEYLVMFDGLLSVVEVIAALALIWTMDPFSGVVFTAVLVGFVLFNVYLNRRMIELLTPIDAEFRAINRRRVELLDNIERVVTCGKEAEELEHLERWYQDVTVRDRRIWHWLIAMFNLRAFVILVIFLALFGFACWRAFYGDWTVGMLFPFWVWGHRYKDRLWVMANLEHRMNKNMPSVRSMREALTMEPEVREAENAVDVDLTRPPRVVFENVSFAYPRGRSEEGEAMPVLRNVSFTIEPGEKVALVGLSGAGKTTIMRLLLRYMDPTEGRITINGIDLRQVSFASLRKLFGYVPQDAGLFDGTVRENLLFGLPRSEWESVAPERLEELADRLQLRFRAGTEGWFETVIGRRGIRLSGGQAQRLMVASAVAKHPKGMVVDEATSSLDSKTERAVQDGLAWYLGQDVSALIVTHRLSTVRRVCTKFVVLRPEEDAPEDEGQVEHVADSFDDACRRSETFGSLAEFQGLVREEGSDRDCPDRTEM